MSFGFCNLTVAVKNTSSHFVTPMLTFNAFDRSGAGIAYTLPTNNIPPYATITWDTPWCDNYGGLLDDCSRIASVQLDRTMSLSNCSYYE